MAAFRDSCPDRGGEILKEAIEPLLADNMLVDVEQAAGSKDSYDFRQGPLGIRHAAESELDHRGIEYVVGKAKTLSVTGGNGYVSR